MMPRICVVAKYFSMAGENSRIFHDAKLTYGTVVNEYDIHTSGYYVESLKHCWYGVKPPNKECNLERSYRYLISKMPPRYFWPLI